MDIDFRGLSLVIFGCLILLNMFGYNPPVSGLVFKLVANDTGTSEGKLINYSSVENPIVNTESNEIWTTLFGILAGLGLVGVIVSLFTRTPPVEYISAPFIALMAGGLVVDLLWLASEFWSYGMPWSMFSTLIFPSLILLLIYSAYEYWRNP